jgi:ABC-type arginine transport system ATPase subunit
MAQRFGLYADLSVEENMTFYADLFGLSQADRNQLVPRLLQMTRMEPFRGRYAGRLSGGMKQKLALMCTLLHKPQILLLDEPTNGVDPVSRRDFWDILYDLRDPLARVNGVRAVEPAGAALHVFAEPAVDVESLRAAAPHAEIRRIVPSLEDVFIAHIRQSERAA